jgi:PET assembly of cytochrome c oxidase, mitochondrial
MMSCRRFSVLNDLCSRHAYAYLEEVLATTMTSTTNIKLPLPSGGPAIALGVATMACIGAVYYSHYSQVRDRDVMRAGVERDKERLRSMKRQQKQQQEQQQEKQ